jgi:hypothetical protein
MAKGQQSDGFKTDRGRTTIVCALTSNGSRSFTPVLPGIETQADWDEHLARIQASLSPGNYLEEQLSYKVALTLQQWHRLDRYERAAIVRSMEDGSDDAFHHDDKTARRLVMEAGVHALRESSALATQILGLATVAMSMASEQPIAPPDGRLLLGAAFASQARGIADGEPSFDEPSQWTWGAVQQGLEELAKATGKSVEKILLCVCKQATEQRGVALEALEQGVPQLERCLVHDGTPLIHEYHSKVLGRLAKLLNLYGQAQASRLGLNVIQPADAHQNGENADVQS